MEGEVGATPPAAASAQNAARYSYNQPGFASFYDCMVANLPPEYEANSSLGFFVAMVATQLKERVDGPYITVLDLCTGTGAVTLGIVSWWMSEAAVQFRAQRQAAGGRDGTRLYICAMDHSFEMLTEARRKFSLEVQGSSELRQAVENGDVIVDWAQADLQDFSLRPGADVAKKQTLAAGGVECGDVIPFYHLLFLPAGSFHHLLTRAEQLSALTSIWSHMGSPSRLVLNIFGKEEFVPFEELQKQSPAAMKVGDYERIHLSRQIVPVADASTGSDGADDVVCTDVFQLRHYGQGGGNVDMSVLESWALRSIGREEMLGLLNEANMEVLFESPTYNQAIMTLDALESGRNVSAEEGGGSDGGGGGGRVFVATLALGEESITIGRGR